MTAFNPGTLVATPGALEAIEQAGQTPAEFLARHLMNDWGEVPEGDAELNNQALKDGSRLLSCYRTHDGVRLWIITEAEDDAGVRSATTILLPEEY